MVSVFPAGHWPIRVISVPTLDSQPRLLIWLPSCNSKKKKTRHNCSRLPSFPNWITATAFSWGFHLPHINPSSPQKLEQFSFLNKVASLCFVKSLHLKSKLINVAQEPVHCSSSSPTVIQSHNFFCCSWNKPSSLFYLSNAAYAVSSPWNTFFPTLQKGSFSSLPPCYFFPKAFFITQTRGGIAHLSFLFISFLVPIKTRLFLVWICFTLVLPGVWGQEWIHHSNSKCQKQCLTQVRCSPYPEWMHCILNCFYIHAQNSRKSDFLNICIYIYSHIYLNLTSLLDLCDWNLSCQAGLLPTFLKLSPNSPSSSRCLTSGKKETNWKCIRRQFIEDKNCSEASCL